MRLNELAASMLLACALPVCEASAYDGTWKGESKPIAACDFKVDLAFTIKDGELVQFSMVSPQSQATVVQGRVKEDGTATIRYGRTVVNANAFEGTLTFNGSAFEGKLKTLCGVRDFVGVRE